MSRIRALVAAALGLGLFAPGLPGPAYGDITATGYACGFTAVTDPAADAGPGVFTGEVDGGPVVVADLPDPESPTTTWDPAATPSSGTIACTIQVNTGYHAGSDAARARASGTGVVTLPPNPLYYLADGGDWVYLCTEWVVRNGLGQQVTMYLDSADGGGTGEFVSDPWSANCAVAIVGTGPEPVEETEKVMDSMICPTLQAMFPPDGDISGIWDCPPYGNSAAGAGGNGEAQAAREAAPGQGRKKTTLPFHPAGTIEITQLPTGTVTFAYSGFSPALTLWNCQEAGTSVTCTPPAPGAGFVNVCGDISVDVTNNATGTASGTTACATSTAAVAVSLGPTAPGSDSDTAKTAFPWTCEGFSSPPVPAAWVVRCAVAPPTS